MPRRKAGETTAAAAAPKPDADKGASAAGKITRTRPVRSTRQFLETQEQTVGQDRPRRMKARGAARESLEARQVEVVDRAVSKDKLDMLKFMEEEVTVLVHDSTNPVDDPIPTVWNGGVSQRFLRGKEQVVKRKFVEILARSKKTAYSQKPLVNGVQIEGYQNIPHTALLYPFSVIHDPNPRGRDWLKGVLAEA